MAPFNFRRQLGSALFVLGAFIALAALGWWWETYSPLIASGSVSIGEAVTCSLSGDACAGDYAAKSLWMGSVLLGLGVILGGWRRPEAEPLPPVRKARHRVQLFSFGKRRRASVT